ncbi:rRNA processing/ribosome biogenesis-domain-containing protein [Gymnopilus junonius]|uniref:Pre-rRNA-processing protein RIX1 n=1 Tax=Gymnopilus junonius TaxID=109634 RepID=A0A9P5P120_GYMJU|nr:rRNA processing/ribosome biogenesis-domain-containing protein [Gymnopilus junonius]
MEPGSNLKSLLQTQLASDASATRYLPYCLSMLTADSLQPSPHSTKWTTRINALLHSKESGARWAGLCLAYKSSLLSQGLMIDAAQSWITTALPIFSRNEPIPVLKAAIRLLRVVFTTAVDVPEFHRQICIPNVVKFTSAIVSLVENNPDLELCITCLGTLTQIVTLYPTTHRASSAALSAVSIRYLNGSPAGPTDKEKVAAASQLYAVLPLTGGKVGAINLWRKSVDETLAFGWESFHCLRTTFPIAKGFDRPKLSDEPQVVIPMNHDRLHCCITTFQSLLSDPTTVQVPLGDLVRFIFCLLSCSTDEKIDGFIDPSIRAMEVAEVPHIWALGCTLLTSMTEQFHSQLNPHSGQLLSVLAFQLDKMPNDHQRLYLLKALDSLLKNCYLLDSSVLPTRLAKAVLPSITQLLSLPFGNGTGKGKPSSSKDNSGKKRARNYEGDEVFKLTRRAIFSTAEERHILLLSIDVVQVLFKNPNLSSAMQSIIARIFIFILLFLPRMPASLLSEDPSFLQVITTKVQKFAFVIGSGTTSVMGKALPFVIQEGLTGSLQVIHLNKLFMQNDIAMLLHPRVPPLVRSMPHVELLSLWKAEESQGEAEILSNLMALNTHDVHPNNPPEDIVMNDQIAPALETRETIQNATLKKPSTTESIPPFPLQLTQESMFKVNCLLNKRTRTETRLRDCLPSRSL